MAHEEVAGSFQGYAGSPIEGAALGAQIGQRAAATLRKPGRLERVIAAQEQLTKMAAELTSRTAALAHRLNGPQREISEGTRRPDDSNKTPGEPDLARRLEMGVERIGQQLGYLTQQIARLEEL